jgi:hypothetical protein
VECESVVVEEVGCALVIDVEDDAPAVVDYVPLARDRLVEALHDFCERDCVAPAGPRRLRQESDRRLREGGSPRVILARFRTSVYGRRRSSAVASHRGTATMPPPEEPAAHLSRRRGGVLQLPESGARSLDPEDGPLALEE